MRVLVTGGGGYVGSRLVPELSRAGHTVRVLDLFWYGREVLPAEVDTIEGDIRDGDAVARAVAGMDAVIHLACISNDPSFELDGALGKSINFDAFEPLLEAALTAGVQRFVYASSSSVYGISDAPEVTEEHPLRPLTDYSKFKAACEPLLLGRRSPRFCPVVIRPATLCGTAPRQRLDLTVNILTNHAVSRGRITVFGGQQKRPNLHIGDMVDLYLLLLQLPAEQIAGGVYNVGYENHTVLELAQQVQRGVGRGVEIETTPTNDLRSYHISSAKIRRELGFVPRRTIQQAVEELAAALDLGSYPGSMTDDRYFNVKRMQRLKVS